MTITATLNILIADDETPARNRLREILAEIPETKIVAEAVNGKDALTKAAEYRPDVMLLDIRMPVMDGLETAEHSLNLPQPPAIIFTTAYDEHAMQAFDMNAVDYLLKPIRRERLAIALKKARALLPAQLGALKELQPQRTHFSVSERGRILLVPVRDVIYLRAELKYLTVRTKEREYLIEDSLVNIEKEFPGLFVRLHRNCLVAQTSIRGFERQHNEDGESHWAVLLKELPETLPVSRRQQHIVHEMRK
ncbi:MAG: LytTR family DNA-binding domain-containing protein [Methylobacillus sp.]|jgi:two-component system response regulator AlgR|nr:LytTR family DNA-binding domain-containing protein [Methylobacillus sp.]